MDLHILAVARLDRLYNPGDERPLRRLVSTLLSPLATAYLLLAAILVAATWRRESRWLPWLTALLAIGLLFTYSRTTIAALAVGLVVLGYAVRSWWPVAAAVVFVAAAFFFVRAYPDIAPETRFTADELAIQRAGGQEEPTSGSPLDPGESSIDSHLDSLRAGILDRLRASVGLRRRQRRRDHRSATGREIKAGESTYTELGVELGLLGMLAFIAWNAALVGVVLRREPWLGAALVAVLALARFQTDVDSASTGLPWCLGRWRARRALRHRPVFRGRRVSGR